MDDVQLQDAFFYPPPLNQYDEDVGGESLTLEEVSWILDTDFGEQFGCTPLEPTPIGHESKVVIVPEVSVHEDHKLLTSDLAMDLVNVLDTDNDHTSGLVNNRKRGCEGDEGLGTLTGLVSSDELSAIPSSPDKHQDNDESSLSFTMRLLKNKNKKRRTNKNYVGASHTTKEDSSILISGDLLSLSSMPCSSSFESCPETAETTPETSEAGESNDSTSIDTVSSPFLLNPDCTNIIHTRKWNLRYTELLAFKAANGHCCVPNVFPPNKALAQWVKRQRYQYKRKIDGMHSTVTEEREKALENIGFVWDSHSAVWRERFEELSAYRKKHGHCNIPSNRFKTRQLSVWAKCQRRQYRLYQAGNPRSSMTPERIAKLESIDFAFNPRNLDL